MRSIATGSRRKPPSPPTCHSGAAEVAGRAVGLAGTPRIRNREPHPLSRRRRWRRRSTLTSGQVRPLTSMALPKNSGVKIGAMSESGM